jgi:hypothetical protein
VTDRPQNLLTGPIIYTMAIPLILLDLRHVLSGDLLSDLRHRQSAAGRLHRVRPASARLSQRG